MCVLPLLSYLTYVEDGARSEENTRDGSEPKYKEKSTKQTARS